jgi:RHS repeat-associated protein
MKIPSQDNDAVSTLCFEKRAPRFGRNAFPSRAGSVPAACCCVIAALTLGVASAPAALVILEFEQPPVPTSGTQVGISSYFEDGFQIKPLGPEDTAPPFRIRRNAGDLADFPSNGSAYLQVALGDSFEMVDLTGDFFTPISIYLAEYSVSNPGAASITFTGFDGMGGSIMQTFVTDGVNDGPGGGADFETFLFSAGFANIVRLETTSNSFSLDYLIVNVIPEPASLALLALGAVFLMGAQRRRHVAPALIILCCLLALGPNPAEAQLQSRPPGSLWLDLYGLETWELDIDHDGDDFTARQEYSAGTDPFDNGSFLSVDVELIAPDTVMLSWDSVTGAVYRILYSATMSNFQEIAGPFEGDGTRIEIEVMPSDPGGFFCLEALQPIDFDADGLSAIEEPIAGTDPRVSDTDRDSILDGAEILDFFSNPTGGSLFGGTIQGTVFNDTENDGDLTGDAPLEGITVFLDANFNGVLDRGERTARTDENGDYEFVFVAPGLHHVRQNLPAPNVQTFPVDGQAPTYNYLPDEVFEYTHAAPGVGNFDEPYGENASDWPAGWSNIEFTGPNAEPVDPNVVLKPIGVRDRVPNVRVFEGTEFLSLPTGASITLRFDEPIVDGLGPDLLIYPGANSGTTPEEAELLVGTTPDALVSLGLILQQDGIHPLDLADHNFPGPVHFVKLISQNNGGDWFGYDFVGMEVLNAALPDPGAHIVTVTSNEVFENRDFGRYFRDLPPTLILTAGDGEASTVGLRAGEIAFVGASAVDDIGIANLQVSVNGQPVALDANGSTTVPVPNAGKLYVDATTTDSGGQTVEKSTEIYVLNADGTFPFDPSQTGQSANTEEAPRTRILTPGPGFVFPDDIEIVAEIIGSPAVTQWTLEIAPVDAIDPYDLTAPDADYQQIAAGSGNVYSAPIATVLLSTMADGVYFLRLCARNSPTKIACYGQVIAKNVTEADLRPIVTIESPAPGTMVMLTADITGTITSTRPLREWYIDFARTDLVDLNDIGADDPDWQRLIDGTNTIDTSAVIATIDATVLKNNSYVARVVAKNDIGLGRAEPVLLEVVGDAKFGRNRLKFTDISVDLAGFPLQFTRVYDSLESDEDGEMGFGWTLALQNPDIRETVPDTGIGGLFGSTPFRDGTRVYITAPTGERLGFTFRPEIGAGSAFGAVYKVTFEADPGVYHRLEIPEGDRAFLALNPDGTVSLFFFGFPYNPSTFVLIDPQQKRYTYHEDAGFLRAEDANGNTITANPNGIAHSAGLGITFARDGQGRILSITDPAGSQWGFSYDAAGDLVTSTDPEGRTTTYAYRNVPAHYLETIIDPLGRMPARYEYDPGTGRLLAVIDQNGNRREQTWDPAGFTGSLTTPRGFTTNIEYDARGNVTRETDAMGNVKTYAYADLANPDKETSLLDEAGAQWIYQYDAMGNMTRLIQPTIVPNGHVILEYDAFGNVTRARAPDGRDSRWSYDEKGNLIAQRAADGPNYDVERAPDGRPVKIIESDAYAVSLRYDSKGQLAGLSDVLGFNTSIVTNRAGFISSLTTANGATSTFSFDSRAIPLSQEDANGNLIGTVENPDGSMTATDQNGLVTTMVTDAESNLASLTLPGGGVAKTTRNASGNVASVTDPLGNTITYDYDPEEQLSAITYATGGVETREYDARGLLAATVLPSGKRRTYEFDANRHLKAERWHDAGGAVIRTIEFNFDVLGRLANVVDTAGAVVNTISYGGGVVQPTVVTFNYDGQTEFDIAYFWEREKATTATPVNPRNVTLRRGFLPQNSIIATRFAGRTYHLRWNGSNDSVRYERNPDGTVSKLERTSSGANSIHSRSFFTYNLDGSLANIRHEDKNGMLPHPDADLTIQRRPGGGIAGLATASDTVTPTFDNAGRLVAVDHTNAGIPDETYAYDIVGNRLSSHLQSGPATIATGNQLTALGDFTFTYDLDGNVATRTNTVNGKVTEFSYDHRNRLVSALVRPSALAPPSATIELEYDYANRLIRRTIDGATTWIINDRNMPLGEFADGSTTLSKSYFYSLDGTDDFHAVFIAGVGERWFLKDHLGTVRGTLDENGDLVSWTDYDAFGNIVGPMPPDAGLPRFAGRFQLDAVGLYENRRRFYDPVVGRFTQPDPIRFKGRNINFYAYVGNDPLTFTDPSGLSAAIEYGELVEIAAFYIDNLCKLGGCVGNIWKGVVEGTVNLQAPAQKLNLDSCTIDFLGVTKDCGEFEFDQQNRLALGTAIPRVPPIAGGVVGVVGAVDSCYKATFNEVLIVPECQK